MKIHAGFISSSSSSSEVFSTTTTTKKTDTTLVGYTKGYEKMLSSNSRSWVGSTFDVFSDLKSTSTNQVVTWTTYKSTSYQRIEYFMEAVEKLNSPYSKNNMASVPMYMYSKNVAYRSLYDGFVDVVITFPVQIRLAGIELLNPWNNCSQTDKEYNYWKYLPKKFNIYKINESQLNAALEYKTYEKDVAKVTYQSGDSKIRPIWYSNVDTDDALILLGSYDVNWENTSSYKCFFKFNENDNISIASSGSETKLGTATWKCKQLVIRIFKGYDVLEDYQYSDDYKEGMPVSRTLCGQSSKVQFFTWTRPGRS